MSDLPKNVSVTKHSSYPSFYHIRDRNDKGGWDEEAIAKALAERYNIYDALVADNERIENDFNCMHQAVAAYIQALDEKDDDFRGTMEVALRNTLRYHKQQASLTEKGAHSNARGWMAFQSDEPIKVLLSKRADGAVYMDLDAVTQFAQKCQAKVDEANNPRRPGLWVDFDFLIAARQEMPTLIALVLELTVTVSKLEQAGRQLLHTAYVS